MDVEGRAVLSGFVDSDSHLVLDGDRVEEFTARMSGGSYAASGILTTMAVVRLAWLDALSSPG
ncbi:hypothetical protein GCM10010339_27570 [Streptomyces alanosinicus]|uniref:Uncharacterized protein n=1 Tax=Streptomyces alanosinicus TaxID=68171 RepID=A0A919D256_9ACTN|nr:hypothetical protein GCM10010339_27570 [Streptomyces alanosinicus]